MNNLFLNPWYKTQKSNIEKYDIYRLHPDRAVCSFEDFFKSLQLFSWTPFGSIREIMFLFKKEKNKFSKDSTFFLLKEKKLKLIRATQTGDNLHFELLDFRCPNFWPGDNVIVVKLMPQ